MSPATGDLPTPVSASTPLKPPGLKSLTLVTSLGLSLCQSQMASSARLLSCITILLSSFQIMPPHPCRFFIAFQWLRDLNILGPLWSTQQQHLLQTIFHGLLTPELTLTTEGRPLEIDWSHHTSFTNKQDFLYHSQATLMAHISELKYTLSSCSQPCPVSSAPSYSSLSDADKMLCLITVRWCKLKWANGIFNRYCKCIYMFHALLLHPILKVNKNWCGTWVIF